MSYSQNENYQKVKGLGLSLFCLALALFSLISTQDLKQKNKETLFLTEKGQVEYLNFIENYHISPVAIGVRAVDKHGKDKSDSLYDLCADTCHIFDLLGLGIKKSSLDNGPERIKEAAYLILANEESSNEDFKNKLREITTEVPDIKLTGVPYTNILLDKYSEAIKKTLFPALFAGLFILLLFYFRSFSEALVVFFPGLLGAGLSLGLTKVLYGHSNLITSIIPLLIFVIELSLVLHIHETAKELKNLIKALIEKREPIILMVVTTFIGFGALYLSELKAISDFGVLAAGLILLSTLFTLLWLYGIHHLLGNPYLHRWNTSNTTTNTNTNLRTTLKKAAKFWPTKRILIFGIAALLLGIFSLPKIPIITDASRYFPKSSGLKEEMDRISRDYMGTPIIEVLLPLKNDGGQELYEELISLSLIEEEIIKELNLKVMSSNQLVRFANLKYANSRELPSNRLSYFGLRSKVPAPLRLGYPIDEDYRLTLLGENTNVDKYEIILARIKEILAKNGFKDDNGPHFNGLYYHLMKAQKKMITVLFKSFFSSLLLISFLSWIYFRSRRVFLLFMVVNILPVLASFPLLWLFGLSFNIATVMTYSISLGLIVDSSFHILHALKKEDITENFYLKTVATPIIVGSSFLAICFFLFGLNDFLPIRQFGICLGLVILWGLLMDLKVLPTLFRGPRPLDDSESFK